MIVDDSVIKENYKKIVEDIKTYSIYPEKVKILVASKFASIDEHQNLINIGLDYFGENRAQIYRDKYSLYGDKNPNLVWDYIGRLQKNKIKYIIKSVNLIHSVDSFELLEEINNKAEKESRIVNVLVQINAFNDINKAGFEYDEFRSNYEKMNSLQNVRLKGFMTMANIDASSDELFDGFSKLKEFQNEFYEINNDITELSMGMSNDYIEALKAGATIVRIGTKLLK